MKKQIFKFLIALAPVMFLIGCSDDGDDIKPAPTVTVTGAPVSALPGDAISFTVAVTAPNGGQTLTVLAGATSVANVSLSGTSATETVNYTIPANALIGSQIVFTVQATDAKNLASTSSVVTVQVNDPVIVLEGNLTTQTLDPTKRYLLKGQTFIQDGVEVTMPAGTVILGDKATKATLIVARGGKLNCNGTVSAPVVMTSSQGIGERDRGDWGGLLILGKAFTNQNTATSEPGAEGISPAVFFGSNNRANDNDNSGVYKYLRVEYAGIELTPNNETNSITMGGVGTATVMEHAMVSFGGDDGFEWFGGTNNGKYLISLSTWDDDFDGDYGWNGKVQFGLVVRNPFYADQSQSNAFEIDSGPNDNLPNGNDPATYTTATFSNITVYGPRDRAGRSISGNNVHTMDLRRRVAASIFNTVMGGFPTGLRFNQPSVLENYQNGTGVLANNILIASGTVYGAGSGVAAADVEAYWTGATRNNQTLDIPTEEAAADFYSGLGLRLDNFFARYQIASYPSNPNFTLTSATSTLATGADYTNAKLADAFFEKVSYRGAFDATTDWTDGWAEFKPITVNY